MKAAFEKIINTGVNPNFQIWENHLIRKLNLISLVSISNMILAISFFTYFKQISLSLTCFASFCLLPLVFLINYFGKYLLSIYLYYGIAFIFFIFLNLAWGVDSYIFLWYFPLIFSMIQLLSRKELVKHLIILCSLTMLVIISSAISYKFHLFDLALAENLKNHLFEFNLIFSFSTTMVILLIISRENNSQEEQIRKMLLEKEILLAEVFHRVKNNLNIVTSLLNLKKNISESEEVKTALEECKNRIFSMALVHNNLLTSKDTVSLNFKEYVKNLVTEIATSLGVEEKVEVILLAENIQLELSNSIPCGLILNELITNAYKYAQIENKKLQILIKVNKENDIVELEVHDNGPGLSDEILSKEDLVDTLGIELIKSLADQLNGIYSFHNNEGLVFNLKFNAK